MESRGILKMCYPFRRVWEHKESVTHLLQFIQLLFTLFKISNIAMRFSGVFLLQRSQSNSFVFKHLQYRGRLGKVATNTNFYYVPLYVIIMMSHC